ncbi:antibiotic biosynthesis monooxygenase [uncultured Tateyamaria sp.]|uniref:antibiotic biosynthesis monooxygenase n=1 Tax=uncultured Tateyamaria sp. TaxID=455651 RepID=UPI00262C4A28|nr:antibiotic biosynthesis monooxygenase [uncultured Tateyamaria sp.]
MKHFARAVALTALSSAAYAQETTIVPGGDGVTFVNILKPADGVSLEQLAAELTEAMGKEISKQPGFRAASVHMARDGSYVLNYGQWDSTDAVDAVVIKLQAGELPELGQAFSMAAPEFHPYDVMSVTKAAE